MSKRHRFVVSLAASGYTAVRLPPLTLEATWTWGSQLRIFLLAEFFLTPELQDNRLDVSGIASVSGGTFPSNVNCLSIGWNTAGLKPGQGCAEFINYTGTGGGNAFDFYRVPGNGTPTSAQLVASITPAGAYVQVSDKRTKTNIKPSHYGLKEDG